MLKKYINLLILRTLAVSPFSYVRSYPTSTDEQWYGWLCSKLLSWWFRHTQVWPPWYLGQWPWLCPWERTVSPLRTWTSFFAEQLGSGSDTQSINTFITRYTWENGRRYHADHISSRSYWVCTSGHGRLARSYPNHEQGPNDEPATEQQHLTHHLYQLTLDNALHLAPIDNPHVWLCFEWFLAMLITILQNILDLGTGTGQWAM